MKSRYDFNVERISRERLYVEDIGGTVMNNREVFKKGGKWFAEDKTEVTNESWLKSIEEFLIYERKKKLAILLKN